LSKISSLGFLDSSFKEFEIPLKPLFMEKLTDQENDKRGEISAGMLMAYNHD
jgi:hypothetical protein